MAIGSDSSSAVDGDRYNAAPQVSRIIKTKVSGYNIWKKTGIILGFNLWLHPIQIWLNTNFQIWASLFFFWGGGSWRTLNGFATQIGALCLRITWLDFCKVYGSITKLQNKTRNEFVVNFIHFL